MMHRTSIALWFALACTSCEGSTVSVGGGQDLEPQDTENLPTGSAVGSDVSGAYLFTSFERRSCTCTSGDESELCAVTLVAEGIVLEQNDGALSLQWFESLMPEDDVVLTGGIDADGSFTVGGVNTVIVDGEPAWQTSNLVEGTVEARVGGDLIWTARSQAVLDGVSADCAMVFDLSIAWWDPQAVSECADALDCHPAKPYCVHEECSDGAVGAACVFDGDCATGNCAGDVCSLGEAGDACTFPSDCQSGVCVDDECAAAEDCEVSGCADGEFCYEGACQAGDEGDPCSSALVCNEDNPICYDGRCQNGSEGDGCESNIDCSIGTTHCVMSACYDGSAGDPCEIGLDCDPLLECTPDNVCG